MIMDKEKNSEHNYFGDYFCDSKTELRRMIKAGAVRVNKKSCKSDQIIDQATERWNYSGIRLSIGKKGTPRFVVPFVPDGVYNIDIR
jgi:tyrosyl-tRNA synthetase